MGLSDEVHWCAWGITIFTSVSITNIFLTVILKIGRVGLVLLVTRAIRFNEAFYSDSNSEFIENENWNKMITAFKFMS